MTEIAYATKVVLKENARKPPFGLMDVELETLGGGSAIGDDIIVTVAGRDRTYAIEEITKELSAVAGSQFLRVGRPETGAVGLITMWRQLIRAVSPFDKVIVEKSPKKRQIFMTLTEFEHKDFLLDLHPFTQRKIEHLDYNPHIKIGDHYGNGGWTSHEIINVIASMAGITIGANTTVNYPVRQFTIEPGDRFIDAILEIVQVFDAFFYFEGGKLFIIESSTAEEDWAGAWAPTNVRILKEDISRNKKPTQIRISGNLGEFRPEKYKGYAGNTGQVIFLVVLGNIFVGIPIEGSYRFEQTKSTNGNTQTTIEKYIVQDIFGNDSYTAYEQHTVELTTWLGTPLFPPHIIGKRQILRVMRDTHYTFAHPREVGTQEVIGKRVPIPTGVSVVSKFIPEVEKVEKSYVYNADGTLKSENTIITGLVYSPGKPEVWVPLRNLSEGNVEANGFLDYRVIMEEAIEYSQISRETYMVKRIRAVLDESESESYSVLEDEQIVQAGAVQGNRPEFRRTQTYAATGDAVTGNEADRTAIMNTPAVELSVNTPSWETLDDILGVVKNRILKNEIIRSYEMAGEADVHPGAGITMLGFSNIDGTETILAPTLSVGSLPLITEYTIEQDLINRTSKTLIETHGRL